MKVKELQKLLLEYDGELEIFIGSCNTGILEKVDKVSDTVDRVGIEIVVIESN